MFLIGFANILNYMYQIILKFMKNKELIKQLKKVCDNISDNNDPRREELLLWIFFS
jgi:poly(3-hydroxyalkanoate) synthetase